MDDSITGRFIQPDTIVPEPGDPQSLNRYSYVLNNPLALVDPSGFCSLGPSSGGPDDRSRNMAYQSSCWGIYYSLLDQGIPGLNWQWDYGLGMSISNFATANFATGPGSILGLAGAIAYSGQDIMGYMLLTVGNDVALVNGSPTYYMYVDEAADFDAAMYYNTNTSSTMMAGMGGGTYLPPWLLDMIRPKNLPGRVEKLVPFTQASDLAVAHFTTQAADYINQTTYVYSGSQYIDIVWGLSGLAAFAHSAGTFNWAGSGLVQYAKLARSGIGSGLSLGKMINSLTSDEVKITDLTNSLNALPSQ